LPGGLNQRVSFKPSFIGTKGERKGDLVGGRSLWKNTSVTPSEKRSSSFEACGGPATLNGGGSLLKGRSIQPKATGREKAPGPKTQGREDARTENLFFFRHGESCESKKRKEPESI